MSPDETAEPLRVERTYYVALLVYFILSLLYWGVLFGYIPHHFEYGHIQDSIVFFVLISLCLAMSVTYLLKDGAYLLSLFSVSVINCVIAHHYAITIQSSFEDEVFVLLKFLKMIPCLFISHCVFRIPFRRLTSREPEFVVGHYAILNKPADWLFSMCVTLTSLAISLLLPW